MPAAYFRQLLLILLLFPVGSWAQNFTGLKIAGHRGGYYFQYPESSLQLLDFLSDQFQKDTIMVEIDLRKSKDGTIYIMHDETVDRTTTGHGKISDLDNKDINSLFLKKENGEVTNSRIPTFEDVLRFIKDKNINLMLDIKVTVHEEAYALLKKYKMEHRALTLTFNMSLTKEVARLSNHVSLSALIETENDWEQFKLVNMPTARKVAYINSKTPPTLVDQLKANRIKVMADVSENLRHEGKPLNKDGYWNKVSESKLDILITDFPIEARKALLQ